MLELQSLIVRVLGDVTDLRRKMSKAEKNVEEFSFRMKRAGQALTAGLTLPITAAGVAATKMASDAAEAANKFDVVMGDSADRVRERFEELHKTIPLTRHEMEGLAAGIQDLLVPMGVVRGEAADMSATMVELAGDLASFNNIAPADAIRAITSGLAGESEPLRRFGVDVRVARLEALALEEGLIGVGEELNSTARAQATLLAITRDSTDAIGDAARTADSAANQFKFFWRNVKELGVTIGNQLLPVVTPLVRRLNEVIGGMSGASSDTAQWTIAIAGTAAALGPLLIVVGKLTQAVIALRAAGMSVLPFLGVGGLLAAGLGVIVTLFIKGKLEAAAMAEEVKGLGAAAEEAAKKIGEMTNEQAAQRALELFSRIEKLRLNIRMKEALGDPEKELMPWRMELASAEREMHMLQSRIVETSDATGDLGDNADRAASSVTRLADAFDRAFARDPEEMVSTLPQTGFMDLLPESRRGGKPKAPTSTDAGAPEGASLLDVGPFAQLGPVALALAAAFEIMQGVLEPLQPIIDSLKEPLRIVGTLMGEVLAPVLEVLTPVIERLAIGFTYLIQGIGWVIEAFGAIIDAIPDWMLPKQWEDVGAKIRDFGQGMQDNARAARKEIGAREEATDAINETTRVLNAPQGFKVALARFNATNVGGGSVGGGTLGGSGNRGGAPRPGGDVNVQAVYIQASPTGDSPDSLWRKFKDGMRDAAANGDAQAMDMDLSPAGAV